MKTDAPINQELPVDFTLGEGKGGMYNSSKARAESPKCVQYPAKYKASTSLHSAPADPGTFSPESENKPNHSLSCGPWTSLHFII